MVIKFNSFEIEKENNRKTRKYFQQAERLLEILASFISSDSQENAKLKFEGNAIYIKYF